MVRLPKMPRFRASPSRLTKVNKNLTKAQRQRVQNEEFGALLKFACGRIPAELASWLMSDCFDLESMQLVLPGRGRIAVTANSVSRVLGLPNSGGQVKYEFDVDAIKFFNEEYGLEKGLAPSMDTIVERLMKNKEGDDDFFRSWLIIVVSTFLCPTTCVSISSKFYPPLVDLSDMKNLNWCQFMIDQLSTVLWKVIRRIL
ncbi:hypothetical protein BS78_03G219100 [Paspalum vaginatum]|nr:hypothetical protein BS78_03G219100 [Paspalum vaginatum]